MIAWWSYALRQPPSSQVCWTRNDDVEPVLAFPGRACRWACRCGSQLTVTPLGIRRNKSRVAHIPGTTAAGRLQYVAGLLSSCVRACNTSPSVPAPPQICDCEHTCCATGFVWADCHGGQMRWGHTWHHQDMADPAFRMCLDLRRQEFRGMEARPSMGGHQPALQDPATVKISQPLNNSLWDAKQAQHCLLLAFPGKWEGALAGRVGRTRFGSFPGKRIEVVFRPSNSPRG